MKKALKFAPAVGFLFALIAFILILATDSVLLLGHQLTTGPEGIFGSGNYLKATWTAIIAFILLIIVMLALVLDVLSNFAKMKFYKPAIATLVKLCSAVCLAIIAILIFVEVPVFASSNLNGNTQELSLGGGWIAAGILAIFGALFAACPVALEKVVK